MNIESGNLYVAFQVKNSIFAVPMEDTWDIVAGDQNTIYTIMPNSQKHVKCIVELEHLGQNIGILATETHLVRILANSILEDRITGQKSFEYNGKTYLMLDISQLYRELGI